MPDTAQRSLRLFVVENHAATLKYYRLYLEFSGHKVFDASSIAEALAAIPPARCDVLISDVGLPDGSGWDLLKRLRRENLPHPPYAIAVSGYGTPADREKSREAGFRHHLLKPFNPDDLDVMLEEAAQEIAARNSLTNN
jgi:CheY-like chemotaxis protein